MTITLADDNSYFTTQHGEAFPTSNEQYLAIRFQENTSNPNPQDGINHIIIGDDPIDADDWYFVAFTFGSNGMFLYVAKETDAGTTLQTDQEAYTGGLIGPPGITNIENIQFGVDGVVKSRGGTDPLERPLDGFMDDIRIYDYEMSQFEIDDKFSDGPE